MIRKVSSGRSSFFVVVAALSLFSGCFWSPTEKKQSSNLFLVNVLDKQFFDDCHIPGSLNISMVELKKEAEQWPKTAKVVIYCSNYSCETSGYCCKMLQKAGFSEVFDYEEGIAGWYQAHLKDPEGYPVNGPCQQPYLTMENKRLSEAGQGGKEQLKVITTSELKKLIDQEFGQR